MSETLAPPRRVRVRVRRKLPTPAETAPLTVAPQDITRVDTSILPKISIISSGETGRLITPADILPLIAVDGSPVEAAPTEAAPVEAAPGPTLDEPVADAPAIEVSAALEPLAEAPAADEPVTAALESAPEVPSTLAPITDEPAAQEPAALEPAEDEPVVPATEEPPAEPERSTPARRMPTLAVMAALTTQRAEPAAPPTPEADAEPPARAARPTIPVSEAERLDVSALDTGALDTGALDTGALDTTALDTTALDTGALDTGALDTGALDTGALAAPAQPAQEIPDAPAPEPPAALAVEEPRDEQPVASSSHQMWWPQAARRRAAPETRPISMTPTPADDDPDVTAPRPAMRRPQATQPVREAQPIWSAIQTTPTRAEPAAPTATAATRVATREVRRDVTPTGEAAAVRRRRAASRQRRADARRSTRTAVLSWVAFGHAAIAVVAALVAVIAALRGPEAADAMTVFGWSVTLTLVAGLGAALGYICAQLGLPRLATFALSLSQLGALAWALGLLGPRAALLALAPASIALALRGAGRLSAVAAGLAWLILFIVDEALTLAGVLTPTLPLGEAGAALVDIALTLVGLWLVVNILISLYTSRMNAVAHGRAVEHVALLTEKQLHQLRMQTEDDANALRQALADALRGEQPERVHAHGALSAVGEAVNDMADRLIDLRYDRAERKRLESATRRLTRVIERAWLGLSWSWPDATGTILDDLLALLRTPPPPDAPDLFDENAPTGQVVAPHLFRSWRPSESSHRIQRPQPEAQPGTPSVPSQPSAPTLPSLWPSDAGVRLTNPLELPPSPRWRSPDSRLSATDETNAPER